VPTFSPFPALRYADSELTNLAAPPYDVLTDADRLGLEDRHPANSVRLDYPRDEDGQDRYALAADRLAAWRNQSTLVSDSTATFTVMRMTAVDASRQRTVTTGVVGALTLEPPSVGDILPHEQTTTKDKSDRLSLIRSTRINTSPIWGLSMSAGLGELLAHFCAGSQAVASATDDDGVLHETWVVSDPAVIESIASLIGSSPIVVADGHHRFETALTYQGEQPGDDRGAAAIMCLVVELAPQELTVRAIHRQVVSVPTELETPEALRSALGEWFEIAPSSAAPLPGVPGSAAGVAADLAGGGHLVLVGRNHDGTLASWTLQPRSDRFDSAVTLDSERSQIALSALGVEVAYRHDADAIAAAVASGDSPAGLFLRPATVAQIRAVAEQRTRMPAKTTFFWPKPRTGMLFRPLD
jgi:uncharacterized protein (DUF1015 family)